MARRPTQRVLHIHFGKEGGAERFLVTLATALAADGVEQRFVIRPGRSWGRAVAALGPVIHSDFRRLSLLSRPLARARIGRICRDWRPDAVMAWMPRAALALPRDVDAVRLCRLGDYPTYLASFGACDALVGNTPGIVAHCRALGWDRGTATVTNFPKAVAPRPVPRAAHDTPEGAPLMVTGGRFVARKGMDLALEVAAMMPGLFVWLVGDGRERAALEARADALGLRGRVRFTGWVDEPVHHLAAGDVFLLPSRHEPLGNVLLEAWRAGVPSVATRCEGPAWFVRDGEDGLLVDVDDAAGAAGAVRRILDDRALAQRLVAGASERVATTFSQAGVVAAYRDLFAATPARARAAA